jgi:hypothetical protein
MWGGQWNCNDAAVTLSTLQTMAEETTTINVTLIVSKDIAKWLTELTWREHPREVKIHPSHGNGSLAFSRQLNLCLYTWFLLLVKYTTLHRTLTKTNLLFHLLSSKRYICNVTSRLTKTNLLFHLLSSKRYICNVTNRPSLSRIVASQRSDIGNLMWGTYLETWRDGICFWLVDSLVMLNQL